MERDGAVVDADDRVGTERVDGAAAAGRGDRPESPGQRVLEGNAAPSGGERLDGDGRTDEGDGREVTAEGLGAQRQFEHAPAAAADLDRKMQAEDAGVEQLSPALVGGTGGRQLGSRGRAEGPCQGERRLAQVLLLGAQLGAHDRYGTST